jgi:hypothetical protein
MFIKQFTHSNKQQYSLACFWFILNRTLRSLENRLDKAELKCKEAEHIQRTYMQIKEKLEKEHENHSNMLDDGENEIRRLLFVTYPCVLLLHSCRHIYYGDVNIISLFRQQRFYKYSK